VTPESISMSKRLNELFAQKKVNGEKLLSVFVTAGFPELGATELIITALAENGVDFIELGIPFSDPIADGPVIQKASQQALDNGITINRIFEILKNVRKHSNIPILLMGYLNPLLYFGMDRFLETASEYKADGLILPDWPLEENQEYREKLQKLDLDLIHLIAPNTPLDRIRLIDELSTSFIYCVAYTGVTGQDSAMNEQTTRFLTYIRDELTSPSMVGFGVKSKEDFLKYTAYADGVIIGSAFIQLLEQTPVQNRPQAIKQFVSSIKSK
jgi:tryptophan synthase alpha chain